jgi:hypothetical protein
MRSLLSIAVVAIIVVVTEAEKAFDDVKDSSSSSSSSSNNNNNNKTHRLQNKKAAANLFMLWQCEGFDDAGFEMHLMLGRASRDFISSKLNWFLLESRLAAMQGTSSGSS